MDYLYEISTFNTDRYIKANYVNPESGLANDFEPVSFTPEEVLAESYEMFVTSYLEVLVHLFTGEDPAKILHAVSLECEHQAFDECDCPYTSIPVPTALAYHAQVLRRKLDEVRSEFRQWTTKGHTQRVYKYRIPDGEARTIYHSMQPGHPGTEWEQAEFYEQQLRRQVMEQWYQQGIMLRQALPRIHRWTA